MALIVSMFCIFSGDTMFEMKKLLSTLIMPLPALLLIGFFGLLIICLTRFKRIGAIFVFLSLSLIALVSFQPFTSSLLMTLEREHRSFVPNNKPVDYVMVLGHGHVVDPMLPPTSELSRTALVRLIEGIRIHYLYPNSTLILSGYNGGSTISHALMLAKVAIALGVEQDDILLLETAKDTREEANQARQVVQNKNMALVTSASHMKRALAEFKRAGIDALPAPTNFMAQKEIHQPWIQYAPRAQYLEQFERFWHEFVGKNWQQLDNKPQPIKSNEDKPISE